jgi:hypothetical protein
MADQEMRHRQDAEFRKRKAQLSPFGIVMMVIIYVVSIGVMIAIVPKNAKWWWDTSYPSRQR